MADPLTIAAITGAVRSLFDLIRNLKDKGILTKEEAKSLMDEAEKRRKDAIRDWDSLAPGS